MAKLTLAERVAKTIARSPSEDASAIRRDLETVQRAGITSVDQLIEAVGDKTKEPSIRVAACGLLTELRERRAAKVLARSPGQIGDPVKIPMLEQMASTNVAVKRTGIVGGSFVERLEP